MTGTAGAVLVEMVAVGGTCGASLDEIEVVGEAGIEEVAIDAPSTEARSAGASTALLDSAPPIPLTTVVVDDQGDVDEDDGRIP